VHTGVYVVGATHERGIVEIDPGRRRAGAGLNAADRDVGLRRAEIVLLREVQSRGDRRDIADIAQSAYVHLLLAVGADADGDLVDVDGGLFCGRYRHFFEAALVGIRSRSLRARKSAQYENTTDGHPAIRTAGTHVPH